MIQRLVIKNYILIDALEIDLKSNFTVITGETGAGKSILLGAIGLLTGNRAESNIVRPNEDKCIIEAEFSNIDGYVSGKLEENDIEVYNNECIIRREITSKGKSRSFVNDTPASLSLLKDIGEHLVDIHSQHKNLLLGNTLFQLSVLDLYSDNKDLLQQYQSLFHSFKKKSEELELVSKEIEERTKEREYIEFQLNKLIEAEIQEDEEVNLESEQDILTHTQEIKESLSKTLYAIDDDEYGSINSLNTALHSISYIRKYSDVANEIYDRINSVLIEIKDISRNIAIEEDNVTFDPDRLDYITSRLDTINSLLVRHNAHNTSELLSIKNDLETKLQSIDNSEHTIEELKKEIDILYKQLTTIGNKLHDIRLKSAQNIEKKLINNLKDLGMQHVRLNITVEKSEKFSLHGMDKVEILFSANKDTKLEPVSSIASGGEISRLMLCIKSLIAGKRSLPTIIFDEIDTGVSGDIAEKIGSILQVMGNKMQVMAVTHLPQIAASGKHHIYIYKEHKKTTTRTIITELEEKDRIEEIARMQSGNNLTDISLAAAKELLIKANK